MNLWKYRFAHLVGTSGIFTSGTKRPVSGRRVLMYHSVQDSNPTNTNDIYVLSRSHFGRHMELLSRRNTADDRSVVPLESPANDGVSITFDDGYKDTLSVAAPLLCRHRLPFHVFVTPANIVSGDLRYLSRAELKELSELPGAVIGSHGYSHVRLDTLAPARIIEELKSSKEWLENVIAKPVITMSYPHGAFNATVEEIAGSIGYLYAATSKWGAYTQGRDQLQIPRIDIWRFDTEKVLDQKLSGKWDWMKHFT